MQMYYFSFHDQESCLGLSESSAQGLAKLKSRCQLGYIPFWSWVLFQAHMVVGKVKLLMVVGQTSLLSSGLPTLIGDAISCCYFLPLPLSTTWQLLLQSQQESIYRIFKSLWLPLSQTSRSTLKGLCNWLGCVHLYSRVEVWGAMLSSAYFTYPEWEN